LQPVRLSARAMTRGKHIVLQAILCQQGVALPLVLLVVALLSFFGMHVTYSAINEATMVRNYEHGVRAFYQAEGLVNQAIAEIRKNPLAPDVSGLSGVTLYREHQDAKDVVHDFHIQAIATSGGVTKTVEMDVDITEGKPSFLNYALYGSDIVKLSRNKHSIAGVAQGVIDVFEYLFNWNLPDLINVSGNIFAGKSALVTGYEDVSPKTAQSAPRDASKIQFNAAAYKKAAEAPGGGEVIESKASPLKITTQGIFYNGVFVDYVNVFKTGILYIDGDLEIDEAAIFHNDLTIFVTGNINLNGPIYATKKFALISKSNIDLGTFDVLGSADNPALIIAEGKVYNEDFPEGFLDVQWASNLIDFKFVRGTIVGNSIDLRNINIQYCRNIRNPAKRPPMPEDNMGIITRLSSANWNDLITVD
jgi:hypothetical protein